jgi:cytosine deaminase
MTSNITSELLLRNVRRPADAELVDIRIAEGRILSIGRQQPAGPDAAIIDGGGGMLLPGLIDSHCHVDKTFWGGPWVAHTAGPSVAERISNERARRFEAGYPSVERTTALLRQMSQCGTTHIRTHTDIDPDVGLRGVETVLAAAGSLEGTIEVQQVAFPQQGIITRPGTASLLKEAVKMGAAAIGGVDPAGLDRAPLGQLDAIFDIAGSAGCEVDIHLHDPGELGVWQIWRIIERTRSLGMEGKVSISHAFCWASLSPEAESDLLDAVARAEITFTTAAVLNRPVLPLRTFKNKGITLGCGNDGIRDLWSPYGNGDMLERAMFVAYRSDLRRDEDIALALDCATYNGARILRLEDYGVDEGCKADLIVVPARNAAEAVVMHPARSLVLKNGKVVASSGMETGARPGLA